MTSALLELYRHKTWATLQLIEHCRRLKNEHLDATIAGTYGTIRETLQHLVNAEEGYFSTLAREPFADKAAASAFVLPAAFPDGPVSLEELAERIRRLGPQWERLAQDRDLPGREVTSRDGWRFFGAVPMAQAIHHADDHRSHVLSILGAHGLEVPDLDLWAYAHSLGLMHELPAGPDAT